jgi:hypothetical protein
MLLMLIVIKFLPINCLAANEKTSLLNQTQQGTSWTLKKKCLMGGASLLLILGGFIAGGSLQHAQQSPIHDSLITDCSCLRIAPCGGFDFAYAHTICDPLVKVNDPQIYAHLKEKFPEALNFTSEKDPSCIPYGNYCASLDEALDQIEPICHKKKVKQETPKFIFMSQRHERQKNILKKGKKPHQ